MSIFAVWIDREHAKIFQVAADKMERQTVQSGAPTHHTHQKDHLDQERQEHRLFAEVVTKLKEATNLLIIGPGIAKHHFQNYLTEHHPILARKISACETVDHPTDHQIAALAKKFYKIPTVLPSGEQ